MEVKIFFENGSNSTISNMTISMDELLKIMCDEREFFRSEGENSTIYRKDKILFITKQREDNVNE